MARGVRKTPIEKLNEELVKTQEEMQNHKNAIKTLEGKVKQLQEEINISIAELKELIASKDKN